MAALAGDPSALEIRVFWSTCSWLTPDDCPQASGESKKIDTF
jgi:hypothetical protein